jgi:hypothetical protein
MIGSTLTPRWLEPEQPEPASPGVLLVGRALGEGYGLDSD